MARTLWRCFPWDPQAAQGAPCSPTFIAPGQASGRFDLQDVPPVLYLASSPEHAIGESLAAFRGTRFTPAYLIRRGRPLGLVTVRASRALDARVVDLTDPVVLAKHGLRPDILAHHERRHTQAVARQLHTGAAGEPAAAGFRWWSALTGAWHTSVLFADRITARDLRFGTPVLVDPKMDALMDALAVLGIRP